MKVNIRNVLSKQEEQVVIECKVESIRPALNGRYIACMENEEEVIISRKYAKHVKKTIMEEL